MSDCEGVLTHDSRLLSGYKGDAVRREWGAAAKDGGRVRGGGKIGLGR